MLKSLKFSGLQDHSSSHIKSIKRTIKLGINGPLYSKLQYIKYQILGANPFTSIIIKTQGP